MDDWLVLVGGRADARRSSSAYRATCRVSTIPQVGGGSRYRRSVVRERTRAAQVGMAHQNVDAR